MSAFIILIYDSVELFRKAVSPNLIISFSSCILYVLDVKQLYIHLIHFIFLFVNVKLVGSIKRKKIVNAIIS